MTPQEFVDKYNGRRVKVNDNYKKYLIEHYITLPNLIGSIGVVDNIETYDNTAYVVVKFDNSIISKNFMPEELDLAKVEPLPLPG